MKITRSKPEDAQTERYLITTFIMSDYIIKQLQSAYKTHYFQSKMTKEVSKWCFDFFKNYDDAPKQEIESILEMKSKAGEIEPDLEEEIRNFLIGLSEEYQEWESFNEEYYIELGLKYFKKRSFQQLSEEIKNAVEQNNVDEAEQIYSNYTNINKNLEQSRDILTEESLIQLHTSLQNRPPFLFEMPGALGKMIGPIERETFIGLLGREKVGKTFHLMMFAIAAARQGLNVAMLETGDLTQDQLDTRFYSYFTKKAFREKHAGTKSIPVLDCIFNQTCECPQALAVEPVIRQSNDNGRYVYNVDIKDKDVLKGHQRCIECWKDRSTRYTSKFKGSIWWERQKIGVWDFAEAKKAIKNFNRWYKGKIITEAFPMQSMKASDVRNWCINKQKQDGFIPDVLIVDYPDILLPESGKEYRHQENEKWMILRQISQEFHNCVIVATQADAKSYNRDSLQLANYSEDKRKYSHVTHFYAINKTQTEEELGCSRLSTLLLREDSVKVSEQVTLLQNLNISHPNTASFMGRAPGLQQENENE